MPELDVVTFGEAMVVHLAEPGLPLAAAATLRRTVAGSEFNVAVGLSRLGLRAGWFGRLGDDVPGRLVAATLRAEGVDTSRVRLDPDGWTGLLVRDALADRPVTVQYHRAGSAASTLGPSDVDADYLRSARTLFLSGITAVLSDTARAASERAVRLASEHGLTVVFDPNVRRRLGPVERTAAVLRPLAAAAHVVLAGRDEAELITGRGVPADAAAWFLERAARLVVLKDGARGAWATDGTTTWEQPAVPVHAVDPVGAGDAFAAGFLAARTRGRDVGAALRQGAIVAAAVVAVPGDIEGLPTAAEVAMPSGGAGMVRR
ncbi:sugar kinase [Pseudonocardia sp. GCM10023141]|uniref:sugar kinase n=1 Tax=Pseudonocardia sp. GCM10023141 TaxID=3252653 RepID=UPI00361776F2